MTSNRVCPACGMNLGGADHFCGRCGAEAVPEPSPPSYDRALSSLGPSSAPSETHSLGRIVAWLREATAGEFEILREVGRGGMAAVFLAQDVALARKVAIKVMAPELVSDGAMVERFRTEAVTVARLSHPNIITIHAVRHFADVPYFVMEFIEGRSLQQIIQTSGPLPIAVVRAILLQVGSALGYAHQRGTVHRDIKPANILLDMEGRAIVTDFGIAKAAETPTKTQTGMVFGTPAYISPEQIHGRGASVLTDQYSLGVVAFEMLTGRAPFTGSMFQILHAHAAAPVPSVQEFRVDCPDDVAAAVSRMLAKEPADRWPTIALGLAGLGKSGAEAEPVRAELARLAVPQDRSNERVPCATHRVSGDENSATGSHPGLLTAPSPGSVPLWAESDEARALPTFDTASPALPEGTDRSGRAAEPDAPRRSSQPPNRIVLLRHRRAAVVAGLGLLAAGAIWHALRTPSAVVPLPARDALRGAASASGPAPGGTPTPSRSDAVPESAGVNASNRDRSMGSAAITAESGGARASAQVGVQSRPVLGAPIPPPSDGIARIETESNGVLRLKAGEHSRIRVRAVDAAGNALTDRRLGWTIANPAIAIVDETGRVTARAPGSTEISVTAAGVSARILVTVAPSPSDSPRAALPSPDSTGTASPHRRADLGSLIDQDLERFVSALRSADPDRIRNNYYLSAAQDRESLEPLLEHARRSGHRWTVSEPQRVSKPLIQEGEASVDFVVTIVRRDSFGRSRSSVISFRAHFSEEAGSWHYRGSRLVAGL